MVVALLVAAIFLEIHIKHLALSKQLASIVLGHLVKTHPMWWWNNHGTSSDHGHFRNIVELLALSKQLGIKFLEIS